MARSTLRPGQRRVGRSPQRIWKEQPLKAIECVAPLPDILVRVVHPTAVLTHLVKDAPRLAWWHLMPACKKIHLRKHVAMGSELGQRIPSWQRKANDT